MERGCVEDQPQRVKGSECFGIQDVLRLVGDDTAALRDFEDRLLGRYEKLRDRAP